MDTIIDEILSVIPEEYRTLVTVVVVAFGAFIRYTEKRDDQLHWDLLQRELTLEKTWQDAKQVGTEVDAEDVAAALVEIRQARATALTESVPPGRWSRMSTFFLGGWLTWVVLGASVASDIDTEGAGGAATFLGILAVAIVPALVTAPVGLFFTTRSKLRRILFGGVNSVVLPMLIAVVVVAVSSAFE